MSNVIGPDISFYQDDNTTPQQVDFSKMVASGAGYVIIRAGQRTWVDPDFAYNWQRAKDEGIPRGSYWYYDSRESPENQAELYASQFNGDYGELPLFADFEESYGGMYAGVGNFKKFINHLRLLIPSDIEIGIYTAYYYWKDNVPESMREQFAMYPLWIARYEASGPLIPPPWKTWEFWQYTENGDGNKYGAESTRIDLNYFNGDINTFNARFGISSTPPPPVPPVDKKTVTHKGVTAYQIRRFGTNCVVHVIDPKIARVEVSGKGFATVSDAVSIYGAQIVTNGGGWPQTPTTGFRASEKWVSKGQMLQNQAVDDRGYIAISKNGDLKIVKNDTNIPIDDMWHVVGYDRIILSEGIFNPAISDHRTKDARTGSGITADGKLVLLSVEANRTQTIGFTFDEMGAVLKEFGAIHAGNNDGGSSSAVRNTALSNLSLIVPKDGVGNEARVINHILVFAEVIGSSIPEVPEEIPVATKHLKVTVRHNKRKTPSMYDTNTADGLVVDTTFLTDTFTTDTTGMTFAKLPDGWYQPYAKGSALYMVEIEPEVPQESNVVHTIKTFSDGSITIDGNPYP